MPNIKTISTTVAVKASPEKVFRAVTDWESQSKWILATKVRGVGENSHQLGGKLAAFTGIGKFGFLDTMAITKWEPPVRCEVTHTGDIVKGSGLFEVHVIENVTYFTWTEYTKVPFGLIGNIAWVVIAPFARFGLNSSLKKFKKMIETVAK